MNRFFKQIKEGISDLLIVWYDELRSILSDAAVMLLFFAAPLLYPLVYGFVYNQEVAKEAKLVVVDLCNSPESREFRRLCDATRDVNVVATCANMEEAREMLRRKEAYGILKFPDDFSKCLANREKANIQLYSDMSSLLYYKCFLLTATEVSLKMNKDIQIYRMENATEREAEVTITPVDYEEVAFYNPQSGFDSFLLPAFLMLLIQQTLIIGICVLTGDTYDRKRFHRMTPILRHKRGTFRIVFGKALCYLMIYLISGFYLLCIVPKIFSLPQIGNPLHIITFLLPYIVACTFFGMSLSIFIKEKEAPYVLLVFLSLIFLFISGVSWPASAVPSFWKYASYLLPSTFGIHGFVKLNSTGATLSDISFEYMALLIQIVIYFISACLVYRHRIKQECV